MLNGVRRRQAQRIMGKLDKGGAPREVSALSFCCPRFYADGPVEHAVAFVVAELKSESVAVIERWRQPT